jgi:hypothetical protein
MNTLCTVAHHRVPGRLRLTAKHTWPSGIAHAEEVLRAHVPSLHRVKENKRARSVTFGYSLAEYERVIQLLDRELDTIEQGVAGALKQARKQRERKERDRKIIHTVVVETGLLGLFMNVGLKFAIHYFGLPSWLR